MDASGDPGEPVGAVVHRVETGEHGEEHLGGADVARRALAPDVLLPRLQGEAQRRAARRVDGDADEPAGEVALVLLADGHEAGVGAPVAEGDAEALGGADDHVGPLLPRRDQHGAGEQIGRDRDERATVVEHGDRGAPVPQASGCRRLLEERGEHALGPRVGVARVGDDDIEAERRGARLHDTDRLGVRVDVDDERAAGVGVHPVTERHRLGGGRGLVEQRRVRQVHAGEVGDHRLEVQERLEPTLGDLRLVRRVRRVPGGVLEDVALDDGRRDRARVAGAEQRDVHLIAVGEAAQLVGDGRLVGGGRQGEPVLADARRDDRGRERLEGVEAERREHGGLLGGVGADVAVDESRGLEVSQGHGRSDVRCPGHRCGPSLPRCRWT